MLNLHVVRVANNSRQIVRRMRVSRDAAEVSTMALLDEVTPVGKELKVWAARRQQLAEQNRREILARKEIRRWLESACADMVDERGRHLRVEYEFWPGPTRQTRQHKWPPDAQSEGGDDPDIEEDSWLRARAFSALIPPGKLRHWGVVGPAAPDNAQWGDDCLRIFAGDNYDLRLSSQQRSILMREGAIKKCKKTHPYQQNIRLADDAGSYGPSYPSAEGYEIVRFVSPAVGTSAERVVDEVRFDGARPAEESAALITAFIEHRRQQTEQAKATAELAEVERATEHEFAQQLRHEQAAEAAGDAAAVLTVLNA
jgi:hypothetical protein